MIMLLRIKLSKISKYLAIINHSIGFPSFFRCPPVNAPRKIAHVVFLYWIKTVSYQYVLNLFWDLPCNMCFLSFKYYEFSLLKSFENCIDERLNIFHHIHNIQKTTFVGNDFQDPCTFLFHLSCETY